MFVYIAHLQLLRLEKQTAERPPAAIWTISWVFKGSTDHSVLFLTVLSSSCRLGRPTDNSIMGVSMTTCINNGERRVLMSLAPLFLRHIAPVTAIIWLSTTERHSAIRSRRNTHERWRTSLENAVNSLRVSKIIDPSFFRRKNRGSNEGQIAPADLPILVHIAR